MTSPGIAITPDAGIKAESFKSGDKVIYPYIVLIHIS
jgi:hypothetical protein